jgi:predicted lipoprotein with Yx(FWY)xxD motif
MTKLFRSSAILLISSLLLTIASCDKNSAPPPAPVQQVKLQNSATLGNYLTDKDGNTLYYFSNDFNGANNCLGGCAALWPEFNVDNLAADQLGSGLKLSDFSSVTTSANKKQVTYKGFPLYYYAPLVNGVNTREAPGQTTGENVGGIWFVAKPDYSIMLINAQLVGHDGKNYKSDYTEGTGKTVYFADSLGRTLYAYKVDKANKNNFTKQDFSNNSVWPIYETDKMVVPSTLDKTLFGSIDVFGRKQLTYKGWPLYYFGQDGTTRGANKGISFPSPGIWPVVTKNTPAATP